MTKQGDVEALLGAVRALVSSRFEDADPLLLTSEHCIAHGVQPHVHVEAAGQPSASSDLVLRDFARLTLITPVELDGEGVAAENAEGEPDLAALRALIREVFREEVRARMGPRINQNIRKIVQQELDRRLDPMGRGTGAH
ncbi:MAG: hypothetical protein OIF40_00685 [Mangrovicoccus sp.]|nr:hypothetical protein [Mangrovicoccus sp.]